MALADVFYCYRCGKHVRREGGKCWYCSAPTRRTIRPARHCPFCDEEIGNKAVKCPHCGEFLDGRPNAAAVAAGQQAPQQIFFVIDKAIIQGEQPLMLQGGGAVPPEVADRLSRKTLQAIQMSNPALLDQQGVRALPAPAEAPGQREAVLEGSAIVDIPADEVQPELADAGKTRGKNQYPPVRRPDDMVPASRPDADSGTQLSRALVRGASYALAKAGDFAVDLWTGAKKQPEEQVDAKEPEELYANCPICATELLKADNYCYHCGTVMRPEAVRKIPKPQTGSPTFGLLAFALILMGVMVFAKDYIRQYVGAYPGMGYVMPALGVISLLLLVSAFFRKRTSLNQIAVILLLLVWLVALFLTFWG